jgi:hypothetical protein
LQLVIVLMPGGRCPGAWAMCSTVVPRLANVSL